MLGFLRPHPTEMDKREAVIAHVMKTGKPCYPSGYRSGGQCLRCKKGPCPGPVERYSHITDINKDSL